MRESRAAAGQLSKATKLALLEFRYTERPVRLVMLDGDPWFVAADLCKILRDHRNLGQALMHLDSEDRIRISRGHLTRGRAILRGDDDRGVWFVSEMGIYELVFISRHDPDAPPFKRWVTRELVPMLRRKNPPSATLADLPFRRHLIAVDPERDIDREASRKRQAQRRAAAVHTLYRFFDNAGNLLYVGISFRIAYRVAEHRSSQRWWSDVTQVHFESYPNLASVQAAETLAIHTEHPRYNTQQATGIAS